MNYNLAFALGDFCCVQENKECNYWKQDEEVIIHAPRSHTKVYIHVHVMYNKMFTYHIYALVHKKHM